MKQGHFTQVLILYRLVLEFVLLYDVFFIMQLLILYILFKS